MCIVGEELERGNGPWRFRILGFQESWGHYDVINGGRKKNYFFRPDVTFEVDAQWLLNRCKDGKKDFNPFLPIVPFGNIRYNCCLQCIH